MKEIACKRVDLWDGANGHKFGFYISANVSDADISAANRHCQIREEVLVVFDDLDEVKANNLRALRKSAWQKLTPRERAALNMLKEPD